MMDLFSGHSYDISVDGRIGWLGDLTTINGKTFLKFNVACHLFKNIEWTNCIAYGDKASLIDKYASKGSEIKIRGHQKTDRWEDKKSKEIKTKKHLVVEKIGFINNTKNANKHIEVSIDTKISEDENIRAIEMAIKILELEGYKITKQ